MVDLGYVSIAKSILYYDKQMVGLTLLHLRVESKKSVDWVMDQFYSLSKRAGFDGSTTKQFLLCPLLNFLFNLYEAVDIYFIKNNVWTYDCKQR